MDFLGDGFDFIVDVIAHFKDSVPGCLVGFLKGVPKTRIDDRFRVVDEDLVLHERRRFCPDFNFKMIVRFLRVPSDED